MHTPNNLDTNNYQKRKKGGKDHKLNGSNLGQSREIPQLNPLCLPYGSVGNKKLL